MRLLDRRELQKLARHALACVEAGELDGELALSYVLWPTPDALAVLKRRAEHNGYAPELAERARELHASGLSCPQVAAELDRSRKYLPKSALCAILGTRPGESLDLLDDGA